MIVVIFHASGARQRLWNLFVFGRFFLRYYVINVIRRTDRINCSCCTTVTVFPFMEEKLSSSQQSLTKGG